VATVLVMLVWYCGERQPVTKSACIRSLRHTGTIHSNPSIVGAVRTRWKPGQAGDALRRQSEPKLK
jgi:hypothetical protein